MAPKLRGMLRTDMHGLGKYGQLHKRGDLVPTLRVGTQVRLLCGLSRLR